MPVTRGKQEPPAEQKDAVSTPPSTAKVEPKSKLTGAGKGADTTRSLAERTAKTTDASKVAGTSTPTSSSAARQRARERRRARVEASPEPDSNSPDPEASAGRIKNLAGFWSTGKDEVQVVRKKRLEVSERTEKADSDTDSSDSDSDLDQLKRAQKAQPSSETIEVEVEKGRAKSIANMWQNRKDEDLPAKRTPFKLDLQTEEQSVYENEPVVLEGVVRSDERAVMDDVIIGRPGRIKNLVVNFGTNTQSKQDSSDEDGVVRSDDRAVRDNAIVGRPGRIKSLVVNYGTNTQSKQDTSDEEEESTEKHSSVATTKTTEEDIERGKVQNVRERWKKRQQQKSKTGSDSDSEGDESSATEDTPQRSSRAKKDRVIEKAKISNLRERWNREDGSGSKNIDEAKSSRRQAPNRMHSLVTAKEYGVFENEPTVRDDVVRADDEQPDIISVDKTQKMRRIWTMMDKEVMKDKEPVERVVKPAKKKEDKRIAEEEVAPVVKPQTTKKVLGRLQGAKEESPKPKEEASSRPKKGHRVKGRGEVEVEKDQQQQQEPEAKGKQLQRAFTIATVADAKPSAPKSPSLMRYSRKKVA